MISKKSYLIHIKEENQNEWFFVIIVSNVYGRLLLHRMVESQPLLQLAHAHVALTMIKPESYSLIYEGISISQISM